MAIDEACTQLRCLMGHEAVHRIQAANVLIVGLKGLGAEIAKNLTLSGVKSLALHDRTPVHISDLSSQMFLRPEDVGKIRQDVTAPRLAELSTCTSVKIHESTELVQDLSQLNEYQVIALTNTSLEYQNIIGDYCHENGIHLVVADTFGLFGFVFCDFGDRYVVVDTDGEPTNSGIVINITDDGVVSVLSSQKHCLKDGDYVSFSQIEGMNNLNSPEPRRITVVDQYRFSIGDVSSLGKYIRGGVFEQVKVPEFMNFKPFSVSIEQPSFCATDLAQVDRFKQLHLGFQALQIFQQSYGQLPRTMDDEDAQIILKMSRSIMTKRHLDVDIDEHLLRELSFQAAGDISAMATLIGGIAAQEILKAITGVFKPMQQWIYFDSLDSLPTSVPRNPNVCKERGSRYDGQVAVFGSEFQVALENWNQFLVGTGPMGCEMLKTWAMMGLGSGQGKISLVDTSRVKSGQLNRNCLFRQEDVGQPKADAACKRAVGVNPELSSQIASYEESVGAETQNVFDYDFWQSLDCVTSTLEEAASRDYVDGRSVLFMKPIVQSRMSGTTGSIQVAIPYSSMLQSSSDDASDSEYPLSTIISWPITTEHTIAWADYMLKKLFYRDPPRVNEYLTDSNFMNRVHEKSKTDQLIILEPIHHVLTVERPHNFADCISWARNQFEKLFAHDIQHLLHHWPEDMRLGNGHLFWDNPERRLPHALAFDANDSLHAKFVMTAAELHAFNFGVDVPKDVGQVYRKEIGTIVVPKFTPLISDNAEVINSELGKIDATRLQELLDTMPARKVMDDFRLSPLILDKTGQPNQYIDLIKTFSILKAMNYDIKPPDPYRSKFVRRKVRPSQVTTASVLAGLASLEIYKIIDRKDIIQVYRNTSIDLSTPIIDLRSPVASEKASYRGDKAQLTLDTTWDNFEVGDITLQELLHYFEQYKISIVGLTFGSSLLYVPYLPSLSRSDRLGMRLSKLAETVSRKPIPRHHRCLIIDAIAEDLDGEEMDIPCVKVTLERWSGV